MNPIRLEEYDSRLVEDLSQEDLGFLLRRHNSAVSVALDPVWGLPRIATTSWIGVIKLPSGRDLRISTKVPVASVFQMLATVGEWPFRPEEIVGYAPESTILFVVARFFRDQLRRLDDGVCIGRIRTGART